MDISLHFGTTYPVSLEHFPSNISKSALVFVAGNEYISLPSFIPNEAYRTNSNSFTISFWIKIGGGPNSGRLFYRRSGSDGTDLITVSLAADDTIVAQILDFSVGNQVTIQSNDKLLVDHWTLLTLSFLTDTTALFTFFSIHFGNTLQDWTRQSTDPVSYTGGDDVIIGGALTLTKPLFIAKISIYSPGSNFVGDTRSCSDSSLTCKFTLGAFSVYNCLFDQSKCDATCNTCSNPLPEGCLYCDSSRYFLDGYCVSKCFTYSDGSCLSTCPTPYTRRIEASTAYCDFKCSTTAYLLPDGSCLGTCPKPAKRSSPRTGENLCTGPCDNSNYFYYPDLKICQASCSTNYLQDSSSAFYKQCILAPVSTGTKNVIKTTERAGTAAKTVTQVTTAISSGSPLGVSAAVAGKIFSNIKYLNITYSIELQSALLTWRSTFISLDFLPDMPLTLESKITSHPVPYMFEKYDVVSSFLINFWENILFLVILALLYLVARMIECAASSFKFPKIFRSMVQNFTLTQLYSFYGDILFYSAIEYRSLDISEGLSGLSFFASSVLIIIMFLCFLSHFRLLKKYQQLKRQAQNSDDPSSLDKFIESKSGQEVLFRDFKDKSLVYQSFLLLLTARDLLFSLILATMFNHPLAQTIIILIFNVAMFAYLLLRPPLTSKLDGAQQLYYEFITLSVNVSVLILAILDAIDSIGADLRNSIGRFVIAINMCFNFGALFFMVVSCGMLLRAIYREYKAKRASKLPDIKHSRPISSGQEQLEAKNVALDESHQQLVNTSMTVHDISPAREKVLETENSPSKISTNAGHFPAIKINGISQNSSPAPLERIRRIEPEPEPKGELESSSTLNNVESTGELLKKTTIESPELREMIREVKESLSHFREGREKKISEESFGDMSRGVEKEVLFEEKVEKREDLRNQETKRKRIISASDESEQ